MVDEVKFSRVLSEFARTLVTQAPVAGILDHLVERIADVLPVSAAGVTLISKTRGADHIAASGATALQFERLQCDLQEGPCLVAYDSGEPVLIPDLAVEGRFARFVPAALEAGFRSVFTFPLRHQAGPVGALDLYGTKHVTLDTREAEVAQDLADVATAYVVNAQTRVDDRVALRHLQHDPLTGLANRILFHERLEHAAARAHHTHANAAILFIDIDDFRSINDRHGRQAGDQLLIAVAERLGTVVGPHDTLARVGADEFAVLCEDLRGTAEVKVICRRTQAQFARPFSIATGDIRISAHIDAANAIGCDYARGYYYESS